MVQQNNQMSYHSKSALIVEPSDVISSALVRMLREIGFHPIYQSTQINEAKRLLSKNTPDIIISERDVNGADALEFLKWCRAEEKTKITPFIFCTSTVEQISVIKALKAGVSEYIAKPFSYASFKKHLNKAFRNPLNSRFEEPFSDNDNDNRDNFQLSISSFSQRSPEITRSSFTILVVDDNPNNINIASKAIKQLGRVKFAIDGQTAIQLCNEFPPDLILLDIMMPDINGYQVFEQLKQNHQTADIPVIFVTAKADEEDIAKGLAMGAVDYVTKPINNKILYARVSNQKKHIEFQAMLQSQITTYIENFALKADLERILFDHLKVPLNNLHDVSTRLLQKSITNNQAMKEGILLEKVRTTITRLIESLNSMVKLEDKSYQPRLSQVNLTKIMNNVAGSLTREMSDKSLSIDILIPPNISVQAEDVLLFTMLCSLLLNAIEAAPRGSQLIVFHKTEQGKQVITFYNRGGVDKSIIERFFDKYITKGKVNGTGLGTYSAKLITEAFGGDIELESNDEETRVHIKLCSENK